MYDHLLVIENLEEEIESLKKEIERNEDTIAQMQMEINRLRAVVRGYENG